MSGNFKIEGKRITADAIHYQKEACEKVIEKEGNYVFELKRKSREAA